MDRVKADFMSTVELTNGAVRLMPPFLRVLRVHVQDPGGLSDGEVGTT